MVDVRYGELAADLNELVGMDDAVVRVRNQKRSSKSRESNYIQIMPRTIHAHYPSSPGSSCHWPRPE
jgi:hypothetical protein